MMPTFNSPTHEAAWHQVADLLRVLYGKSAHEDEDGAWVLNHDGTRLLMSVLEDVPGYALLNVFGLIAGEVPHSPALIEWVNAERFHFGNMRYLSEHQDLLFDYSLPAGILTEEALAWVIDWVAGSVDRCRARVIEEFGGVV